MLKGRREEFTGFSEMWARANAEDSAKSQLCLKDIVVWGWSVRWRFLHSGLRLLGLITALVQKP